MGLVPAANFPSAPKPCRPRLSSPVFQPNHRLHLVRRLGYAKALLIFKPSFVSTYAICEHVKPRVEHSTTLADYGLYFFPWPIDSAFIRAHKAAEQIPLMFGTSLPNNYVFKK
jgi:hypothetical protein